MLLCSTLKEKPVRYLRVSGRNGWKMFIMSRTMPSSWLRLQNYLLAVSCSDLIFAMAVKCVILWGSFFRIINSKNTGHEGWGDRWVWNPNYGYTIDCIATLCRDQGCVCACMYMYRSMCTKATTTMFMYFMYLIIWSSGFPWNTINATIDTSHATVIFLHVHRLIWRTVLYYSKWDLLIWPTAADLFI